MFFFVSVLVTTGLLIVGLEFGDAVLIGLLCGLFNVIPYLDHGSELQWVS